MLSLIFTEFCKIILNPLILQIRKTNLLTLITHPVSRSLLLVLPVAAIYIFLLLLKLCARFGNNKL